MTRLTAATFTALLLTSSMSASNVAVVVDVSGSMATYGNWQPDALALTDAILSGKSTSGLRFKTTGSLDAVADFKLAAGDAIQLLKFGSVQSDSLPFFASPQRLADLSELPGQFPMHKRDFSETRTNKDLAIAIGSRVAAAPRARLIMISDFLIDSDVKPAQQQFVNEFQASSKIETPLIFAWEANPRVLVKLMATSAKDGNPAQPPEKTDAPPAAVIRILESRPSNESNRISFRWVVEPNVPVNSFRLILRDAKTGRIAKEQGPLAAVHSTMIEAPHAGDYSAIVTAELEDGSKLESRPVGVTIKSRNGGLIAIVLILILLGAGVWYVSARGQRREVTNKKPLGEEEE